MPRNEHGNPNIEHDYADKPKRHAREQPLTVMGNVDFLLMTRGNRINPACTGKKFRKRSEIRSQRSLKTPQPRLNRGSKWWRRRELKLV